MSSCQIAARLLAILFAAQVKDCSSSSLLSHGKIQADATQPSALRHPLPRGATPSEEMVSSHQLVGTSPSELHHEVPTVSRTKEGASAPPRPERRSSPVAASPSAAGPSPYPAPGPSPYPAPLSAALPLQEKSPRLSNATVAKSKYTEMRQYGHRVFALNVIIALCMLCAATALISSSNPHISKHTWLVIDDFTTNFLAVTWFFTADDYIEYKGLKGLNALIVYGIGCIAILFLQKVLRWLVSANAESEEKMAALAGPVVMWLNAGFVKECQTYSLGFNESIGLLPDKWHHVLSLFLLLVVLAVYYLVLGVVYHRIVSKIVGRGWQDDIEHQMGGGAIASGVILLMHVVFTGEMSGSGLGENLVKQGGMLGRLAIPAMIFGSLAWIVIAFQCSRALNTKVVELRHRQPMLGDSNYWKVRLCTSLTAFFQALPGWSLLASVTSIVTIMWGFTSEHALQSSLVVGFVSSMLGGCLVIFVAVTPGIRTVPWAGKLLVSFGAFLMGATWGDFLQKSIDLSVEGHAYSKSLGVPTFMIKFGITIFITANIFPVYYFYLKPMIMAKTEKQITGDDSESVDIGTMDLKSAPKPAPKAAAKAMV